MKLQDLIIQFNDWFLRAAENYGYFGIFFGAFADSIFPLVPSEVIMGAGGYLISQGKLNFVLTLIASLLGNICASIIIWYAGKKLGTGLIDRFGKYLNFSHKDYEKAQLTFNKSGYFSVFYCQFIPLLRSLISIPSGILNLNLKKFILATLAGATIWNSGWLIAGVYFSNNFTQIVDFVDMIKYPLLACATIVILFLITRWYKNNHVTETI
jgi:membrane protein DedA with SNARE-associated domain